MFAIEAFAVLKIKEFTIVNDCFQNKNNDDSGHYGQTQISEFAAFMKYIVRKKNILFFEINKKDTNLAGI